MNPNSDSSQRQKTEGNSEQLFSSKQNRGGKNDSTAWNPMESLFIKLARQPTPSHETSASLNLRGSRTIARLLGKLIIVLITASTPEPPRLSVQGFNQTPVTVISAIISPGRAKRHWRFHGKR